MTGGVRTSVLVVSDTHLAHPFPYGIPSDLPHIDLLIHAGDLTMLGTIPEFHQALDMLATIPADVKLVIPGNHDLALDPEWIHRTPEMLLRWERRSGVPGWAGRVGREYWEMTQGVWFGEQSRAVREGVTMLTEGMHEIVLKNGATAKVYASPYQPEFCDWAFAYNRNEDRFNVPRESLVDASNIAERPMSDGQHAHPDKRNIDFVITHGPPYGRLDLTAHGAKVGCPHLLAAISNLKPRVCCFGHIHEGWGVERIAWDDDHSAAPQVAHSTIESFKSAWDVRDGPPLIEKMVIGSATKTKAPGPVVVDLSDDSTSASVPGRSTTLVNAAIMDVSYKPSNLPILLYINL
ncbi:hypothetical protein CAC42_4741 [Sphaceloma murrayae]|uniref:Calcineurin-like phosphoesterase domain-containing protein n=1 Tax=Sphaceloma murrayae TaxID=2082308 RepID=A0A2K1QNT1_9PEZI|nr:hypothetical protein CAC42_4741 [Sphaceloma murrayae]